MLHIENEYIREHLLDGVFGIEMESLRVVGDGMLSQTAHPFPLSLIHISEPTRRS